MSLDHEMTRRSVAFTPASKAWNSPGLKCGLTVVGSPELGAILGERWDALLPGQPGVPVTGAAFERSLSWLDALLAQLDDNRALLARLLAARLPGVGYVPPEASFLGAAAHIRGEYPAAEGMYGEALELARRAGASNIMARCLSGLGRLALHRDDRERATAYYTESMARFREAGDLRRATLILGNLGVVAFNEGDFDLAASRLEEHLANARKIGDRN